LLHDASEAYLGDVSTPLKRLIGPVYAELESRFMRAIASKFGVPMDLFAAVKTEDTRMMLLERYSNGPHGMDDQEFLGNGVVIPDYYRRNVGVWSSGVAETRFTDRAEELGLS
jgi:hypothetical protein